MNSNIQEICWIVYQRNKWASERGKARSKLNYAKEKRKPERNVNALKKRYAAANAKKDKLKQKTLRLRRLLAKESARLISDRSAGYSAIVLSRVSDTENIKDFRVIQTRISKKQIAAIADSFEAERSLQKVISR